jgi:hypothetical protein
MSKKAVLMCNTIVRKKKKKKKGCLYETSKKLVVMTGEEWPKLSSWILIEQNRALKHIWTCAVSGKAESTPGGNASLHIRENTMEISAIRDLVVKETLRCACWGSTPGSKYIRN